MESHSDSFRRRNVRPESVEEKALNSNMELFGVIASERNTIRNRHVWKLLEEQNRVLRSYYAQHEGFDGGGKGAQGQRGFGREIWAMEYTTKTKNKNRLVSREPE
jgi:hypothetical protein